MPFRAVIQLANVKRHRAVGYVGPARNAIETANDFCHVRDNNRLALTPLSSRPRCQPSSNSNRGITQPGPRRGFTCSFSGRFRRRRLRKQSQRWRARRCELYQLRFLGRYRRSPRIGSPPNRPILAQQSRFTTWPRGLFVSTQTPALFVAFSDKLVGLGNDHCA
jgi:hypothetical protein